MKAAIFVLVALCSLGLTLGVSCVALYKEWAETQYYGVFLLNSWGPLDGSHFVEFFDMDEDGVISKKELNAKLEVLNITVDPALKEAGVALWDTNGDGTVTVDEAGAFLGGTDADGDGSVNKQEAVTYWSNFYKTITEVAGVKPTNCQ